MAPKLVIRAVVYDSELRFHSSGFALTFFNLSLGLLSPKTEAGTSLIYIPGEEHSWRQALEPHHPLHG